MNYRPERNTKVSGFRYMDYTRPTIGFCLRFGKLEERGYAYAIPKISIRMRLHYSS